MVAHTSPFRLRPSLPTRILARLELIRLRTHFRRVARQLGSANLDQLTPELRRARTENLARLRGYAAGEFFPRNTDEPRRRIPYFKDRAGTHCAVAHLIAASGRQDVVEAVAASDNHVYVDDIHDGPVLDWIRSSGFGQSEVALIQPTYCWDQCADRVRSSPMADPGLLSANPSTMRILMLISVTIGLIALGYMTLALARRRGRREALSTPQPSGETVADPSTE